MSYWGFVLNDLIKELHLGLDFVSVSQTQIAQRADPTPFLVGSKSWRLYSLWDAWQEVKAPAHRGLLFLETLCLGCSLPIWRGSGACADITACDMIVSICPACFLSLLWSPHKFFWVPIARLSSAFAMDSGFSLKALFCSLFSFPE